MKEQDKIEEPAEKEEWEDSSFIARPPSVERKYIALEDKRSLAFRSHCQKHLQLDLPSYSSELDCMELLVERNRRSGLDVVCKDEYDQYFANARELRDIPPRRVQSRLKLLDGATLQKMKLEKLRGTSNLFDIQQEYTVPSPPNRGFNVEYRSKDKAEGLTKATLDFGEANRMMP